MLYLNICMFQTFIMIRKTFKFKFFLSGSKFGFASNIWACLSANITISNIVTGIISEPQKLQLPDIVEFTFYSFRTRTFVTILAFTSFDVASDRPASRSVDLTGLFLAKEFVCMFSFLLIVVTSKHYKYVIQNSYVWFNCAV